MHEKNHRPEDRHLASLFANNRLWSASRIRQDPKFFSRLASQQAPAYLWIGCSDSRVPANEIIGLEPGEVFVHRNVANLVLHSDMNCLSVLQYAVEVLHVSDVIVCGHYGCGGVLTAMEPRSRGLISNWLRPIRELAESHADELAKLFGRSKTSPIRPSSKMPGTGGRSWRSTACVTGWVTGYYATWKSRCMVKTVRSWGRRNARRGLSLPAFYYLT